mmetsp:Transcript_127546/g.271942  ORF Transcript_127546/g.271942 Transcript_127546/m.271942 type:complete len:181 (-) Transcript_127546:96-638(-)
MGCGPRLGSCPQRLLLVSLVLPLSRSIQVGLQLNATTAQSSGRANATVVARPASILSSLAVPTNETSKAMPGPSLWHSMVHTLWPLHSSEVATNETSKVKHGPRFVNGCDRIMGIPKLAWALIANALSLLVILLCVPFILTCSRRRAPGAPLFDCGHINGKDEEMWNAPKKINAPWLHQN